MRMNPKIAVGVVFVASLFMSIMDTTIVNVALPAIGRDFGTDPAGVGVINVGYLVSLAVFVPLSGWLGDRYGTRRVFLAALTLFTVASLLCGAAGSMTSLTLYRILQGAAGGLLTPVGMTMLFRAFPQEERMRATRVLMLPTAVAPAAGPVLGGWLVDGWSWHWVFIVNVPVGIAALVFGLLFLPDYRAERAGRFDAAGFLLSAAGFGAAMYALSEGASEGWGARGSWPRRSAACSRWQSWSWSSCAAPSRCSTCGSSGTASSAPPTCSRSSPAPPSSACSTSSRC